MTPFSRAALVHVPASTLREIFSNSQNKNKVVYRVLCGYSGVKGCNSSACCGLPVERVRL